MPADMLYSWQLAVECLCMLRCDFSVGMLVALGLGQHVRAG